MNNELLLLIQKHTDTFIERTKTKPQEKLEFKLNKQMESFSFNPPIDLFEEGKGLLAIPSLETTNSILNITSENNSFSITISGHWNSQSAEKTIDEPIKLLELRSQNDIDLYNEQVRKKGIILIKDFSLSNLDTFKNEILEELENANYNDLEDMVYRMQLTYDKVIDLLDPKYIPSQRIGYSLNPGIYEITDINKTLKYILPDNVKVTITIDDIRLKSNLIINQTLIFTKNSFFYTFLGFTQSVSGVLGDIEAFIQKIPIKAYI